MKEMGISSHTKGQSKKINQTPRSGLSTNLGFLYQVYITFSSNINSSNFIDAAISEPLYLTWEHILKFD